MTDYGRNGLESFKVVTGAQGPPGVNGTSIVGPIGVTGAVGQRGFNGSDSTIAGPAGVTGAKGDTGDTGAKGDTGNSGSSTAYQYTYVRYVDPISGNDTNPSGDGSFGKPFKTIARATQSITLDNSGIGTVATIYVAPGVINTPVVLQSGYAYICSGGRASIAAGGSSTACYVNANTTFDFTSNPFRGETTVNGFSFSLGNPIIMNGSDPNTQITRIKDCSLSIGMITGSVVFTGCYIDGSFGHIEGGQTFDSCTINSLHIGITDVDNGFLVGQNVTIYDGLIQGAIRVDGNGTLFMENANCLCDTGDSIHGGNISSVTVVISPRCASCLATTNNYVGIKLTIVDEKFNTLTASTIAVNSFSSTGSLVYSTDTTKILQQATIVNANGILTTLSGSTATFSAQNDLSYTGVPLFQGILIAARSGQTGGAGAIGTVESTSASITFTASSVTTGSATFLAEMFIDQLGTLVVGVLTANGVGIVACSAGATITADPASFPVRFHPPNYAAQIPTNIYNGGTQAIGTIVYGMDGSIQLYGTVPNTTFAAGDCGIGHGIALTFNWLNFT